MVDFEFNLSTETVEQLLAPAHCVEVGTSVREVMTLLKARKAGSVLVCRDGVLVGIFTERDALRLMAAGASIEVPIDTVMVRNPVTLKHTDTVATAIQRMSDGGYRRLPVLDGSGRPVGLVKATGIVHFLAEHFPQTVYNLPPAANPVMHEREGA
jgi:CBS domain-containing protein